MSSYSSIELIILDLRYFLDEAISFLECKKSPNDASLHADQEMPAESPRTSESNGQQEIDSKEFVKLRLNAIEYTRLIFDLKHLLQENRLYAEFNVSLKFSDQFKSKRMFFFRNVFRRLEHIYLKISSESIDELVIFYFQIVRHLTRQTNEFIAYLEFSRWRRSNALNILDKLVNLCNDFLCILEKIVQGIEDQLVERKNRDSTRFSSSLQRNSSSRKSRRDKLFSILKKSRHKFKHKLIRVYYNVREKVTSSRLLFWLSLLFLMLTILLIILTCIRVLIQHKSNYRIAYSIDFNNMLQAFTKRLVHRSSTEPRSHLVELRKEIHFQICLNDFFDLIFKCFLCFFLLFLTIQKIVNVFNH